MSNDLISREALKKDITEIFEIEEKIDKKWAMGLKYSLKIIDKAPIVEQEVYVNGKDYDLYLEGYKQGKKDFERPQGEWKKHYSSFVCSECGQIIGKYKKNFCATCGADMRDGKDNENKS